MSQDGLNREQLVQELHRPFSQICWGAQVVVREGVGVMLHVRADESEGAQYVQELKG